jgi:hypothetical protein
MILSSCIDWNDEILLAIAISYIMYKKNKKHATIPNPQYQNSIPPKTPGTK